MIDAQVVSRGVDVRVGLGVAGADLLELWSPTSSGSPIPRLLHGSGAERANWELFGQGHGVHRPDLDEGHQCGKRLLSRIREHVALHTC